MNRDSIQKLRLDRRMIRRHGWISGKELETALETLPDASEKMTTLGDAEDGEAPDVTSEGPAAG